MEMELYKGKRIGDNKWVYGHLLSISPNKAYIVTCVDETSGEIDDELNGTFWLNCLSHMIDSKTVCRFTGLYDCRKWKELTYKEKQEFLESWNWQKHRKNTADDWQGRMIWDNDIVQFQHGGRFAEGGIFYRNYRIEYTHSYFHYGLRFVNKSIHFPCKRSTVVSHSVYVIGNIFDHPDLLEAGKYRCPSLRERLEEVDMIIDDEAFCKAEYEIACDFFEENHYLLTEEDMSTVMSRGLEESFEARKASYIERLWLEFGDIPMDPETECIEMEWYGFPAGTHREVIWHWFEDTYDVSVAEDLMHV